MAYSERSISILRLLFTHIVNPALGTSFIDSTVMTWDFPGGSVLVKESTCQCRRFGFSSWVRKIPCRRKWQSIPVFLPGKFHGQRNLEGYSPWDHKKVRQDLVTE